MEVEIKIRRNHLFAMVKSWLWNLQLFLILFMANCLNCNWSEVVGENEGKMEVKNRDRLQVKCIDLFAGSIIINFWLPIFFHTELGGEMKSEED